MAHDVIEVSYTGDLLAHRRCRRAWAYEKQAGFHPYEQVQAMEGRLLHHAFEWMTAFFARENRHATADELRKQLEHYWKVLYARGIKTAFGSKEEILNRIIDINLFPKGQMHRIVKVVIEGAKHTEYELRAVRRLKAAMMRGKSKLLLTGILDLVIQQQAPLTYKRTWKWTDIGALEGKVLGAETHASAGDVEIWDYKGTRATSEYVPDYVRQLLTYAALYRDRSGSLPKRCVLYFVNETDDDKKLLAVDVDDAIVEAALAWTERQVDALQTTIAQFQKDPISIRGGELEREKEACGVTDDLKAQCTACGFRFDCPEYRKFLKVKPGETKPDIDIYNVGKN